MEKFFFFFLITISWPLFCFGHDESHSHERKTSSNDGPPYATSDPINVPFVKCFFVVDGEMTFEDAYWACRTRNGALATLDYLSEDNFVRQSLDWEKIFGYQEDRFWVGQLWLSAKRAFQMSLIWDWRWNTTGKDVNFRFPQLFNPTTEPRYHHCLIMQSDDWRTHNCEGMHIPSNRRVFPAGAICEAFVYANPPTSRIATSDNYCNIPLLPKSHSANLPMVNRKVYFFIKGNFTWDQALDQCASNDGQLAVPRNPAENNFMIANLDFAKVGYRAWLGYRRLLPDSSNFYGIDSPFQPISYKNFLYGRPGTGGCIAMWRLATSQLSGYGNFGWNDVACTASFDPRDPQRGNGISALCERATIL